MLHPCHTNRPLCTLLCPLQVLSANTMLVMGMHDFRVKYIKACKEQRVALEKAANEYEQGIYTYLAGKKVSV